MTTNALVDRITFEILRHRLFALNDEVAAAVKNVSGSPAANVGNDFNTGLLSAEGDVFAVGIYITSQALTMHNVVEHIIAEYSENPGICDGDMFICNDPYVGALHQSDVVVVSPIFWQGQLMAWSGAVLHETDVGGTVVGSQCCIGAKSIFDEAPPMPPVKIVEEGRLRKDVKAQYLRRSRFPELLELDLTAKVAANNVARERLRGLIDEYGPETVRDVIQAIGDHAETRLRQRLRELPDGIWRHDAYMEYEGQIYEVRLEMTKHQDGLVFDYRGSSRQAPAVINCPFPNLEASALAPLLSYLCWDLSWSPSGVMRAVRVLADPGTVVYPVWPAGMSKGSTAVAWYASTCAATCLAKMLAASDVYRDRTMAAWQGSIGTQELFGIDWRGEPFGGVLVDSMCGGAGARSYKDGIDMGGTMSALWSTKVDVESYEYTYPMLYLSCRQQRDSGGAGKYRGGAGMCAVYVPHGIEKIPTNIMLTLAQDHPESSGIVGGYPGATDHFGIKRRTNVHPLIAQRHLPTDFDEVEGERERVPGAYICELDAGDAWLRQCAGGGGYGDPLDREPALVRKDRENDLVSRDHACEVYGVIFRDGQDEVDLSATEAQRALVRTRRLQRSSDPPKALSGDFRSVSRLRSVNEYLTVVEGQMGEQAIACRCGAVLAPAGDNYKLFLRVQESSVEEAGPMVNPFRAGDDRFVFRRYYCPACLTLLDTETALRGEGPRWDAQVLSSVSL